MRKLFTILFLLFSIFASGQGNWQNFSDDAETGTIGRWNTFSLSAQPMPYQQGIGCLVDIVTNGIDGAPPARLTGSKTWKFEMTADCQNGLYIPQGASSPITAYWASQNKLAHIAPLLEGGVPALSNPNWYYNAINRGQETGIFTLYAWIPAGARAAITSPLTDNTIVPPGMVMEAKLRFQYNGEAVFDDAQFQVNMMSKAQVQTDLPGHPTIGAFTPSRSDAPLVVIKASHFSTAYQTVKEMPLGQWVKLQWRVHATDSLSFIVNDTLLTTFYHFFSSPHFPFSPTNQPYVGIRQTTGNGLSGGTVRSYAWTFFIGRYATGRGKYFIDDISYLKNVAPVANAGTNIIITSPTSSTPLNGSGSSDPDIGGVQPTYAWTKISGPAGYSFNNAALQSPTVSSLTVGTYLFRVLMTDDFNATSADTVQVLVQAANMPPTADAGTDILLNPPFSSTILNGSGDDPDGTISSYAWAKVSGPATYTIDNANIANPTLTNLLYGIYVFRLTVTDNGGAIAVDDISVNRNYAPIASAGIDIVITLPVDSAQLNGSESFDPEGLSVPTYLWTKASGPASYTFSSATELSPKVYGLTVGDYAFRLLVTDEFGATGFDTVRVTVNSAVVIPPIANAGNDTSILLPTYTLILRGSGTDADGAVVSYRWDVFSGPLFENMFSSHNVAEPQIFNVAEAVYVFQLIVTDNDGNEHYDYVTVNVNAPDNLLPIADAGVDMLVNPPYDTLQLVGGGSDSDGTITYSWSKLSGPTYSINSTTIANPTLDSLLYGTYVFRLLVTDNDGATDADTITFTVNQSPVASAGSDVEITLPDSVNLNGSASSDPDGTINSYLWTKLSGPSYTITNPNIASPTINDLSEGYYIFRLTVTDNNGATATDDITVVVVAIPVPVRTRGKKVIKDDD